MDDEAQRRVVVALPDVSGRASSRWNIVGTMCVCVTPWVSIRRSVSTGSQCSMITSGTPYANGTATEKASGAAWYSGPVTR